MNRRRTFRISPQHRAAVIAVQVGLLCALFAADLAAQTRAPSQILEQYRAQRTTWFSNVWPFANTLFGLLAVIEFAWSAAVMLLEKADLQSWTAALVRKVMWLGAFYALLDLWSMVDSRDRGQFRADWADRVGNWPNVTK